MKINPKYQFSVSLISNNRHQYRPWKKPYRSTPNRNTGVPNVFSHQWIWAEWCTGVFFQLVYISKFQLSRIEFMCVDFDCVNVDRIIIITHRIMFSTQRGESVRLIGCTEQGCSSQCPRVNVHDMWLKLLLLFMEIEMKSISFVFLHRKTHCGHRAAKQRDREIWSRIIWLMLRAPHNLAVFSEDAHTLTHMAALSIYSPSCLISWNQIKRSRLVHVTDIVGGAPRLLLSREIDRSLFTAVKARCVYFLVCSY